MNTITFDERRCVYKKAIQHYGSLLQTTVAIEELAELQKELCKILRNPSHITNYANLAEELADVTIMLEQIREIYNVNAEVCAYMDYKVARLDDRIREDEKNQPVRGEQRSV